MQLHRLPAGKCTNRSALLSPQKAAVSEIRLSWLLSCACLYAEKPESHDDPSQEPTRRKVYCLHAGLDKLREYPADAAGAKQAKEFHRTTIAPALMKLGKLRVSALAMLREASKKQRQ